MHNDFGLAIPIMLMEQSPHHPVKVDETIGHFIVMTKLDDKLIKLLMAETPDEWNAHRRANPTFRPDISGMNLHSINLDGYDLHAAKADKTCFAQGKFVGANCEDISARFSDFQETNLSQSNFRNANLEGADIRHSNFSEANFQNANLDKTKLQWSTLDGIILHNASLAGADLRRASLIGADLRRADLENAIAHRAQMERADFSFAKMEKVELRNSVMSDANFEGAYLKGADFRRADITNANFANADLRYAILVRACMRGANIIGSKIYGASMWGIDSTGAIQHAINIATAKDPPIMVDDLEAAQLLHLFMENKSLSKLITVSSSSLVLILGRFNEKNKIILDVVRRELKKNNFIGVICDFDKPSGRDITETISTLAHLSSFIIADISDPRSVPHELMRIVPNLPSVPVAPILRDSQEPYSMFSDLQRYPWVFPIYRYGSERQIADEILNSIIVPARKYRENNLKMDPSE